MSLNNLFRFCSRRVILPCVNQCMKFQSTVFSWKRFAMVMGVGGVFLGYMLHLRRVKEAEYERKRRRALGKSKIGGPWELVSTDGKTMTQNDFLGKWVLIYFGFTHCPDICPDEIEKMVKVVEILSKLPDKREIEPLFFTVDPDRDTPKAVKEYCADFSPKLRGFTGTKEQVDKVAKTFRVYHSFGPRDKDNDYIVDHTVIMYLMDPEGQFVDYFGQNKKAEEVVTQIELQMMKYEAGKSRGWW